MSKASIVVSNQLAATAAPVITEGGRQSWHKKLVMIPASVTIALLSFVPASVVLTKALMWFIWQVCGFDSVGTMTLFFAGGAWGAWAVMALIEIASWAYDKACSRLYTPYLDALSRRSRGY